MANAQRLRIKSEKKGDIEKMLKKYKNKVNNTKLINKIKEKQEYIKPSEQKRRKYKKAINTRKWIEKNQNT